MKQVKSSLHITLPGVLYSCIPLQTHHKNQLAVVVLVEKMTFATNVLQLLVAPLGRGVTA